MKRYIVKQANLTSRGAGDYWVVDSFDNLEEAQKCMKQVYNNMNGITKNPNGYIDTIIEDSKADCDNPFFIVDGMNYNY